MNNKSSSGLGCALLFFLVIILSIFKFVMDNPGIWILIIFVAILIFMAVRSNRDNRKDLVVEAFNKTADKLDALAEAKEGPKNISLAVRKDERVLFALYNASLVEYASTGSTFTSTNVGVSVPLFGQVRGEVGGSEGSITKNPDVLTTVDTGTVVYTTQRIIFTGARLVRDWEFEKVLNLDLGDNGNSVRIAVSNRGTTSGLKSEPLEFGAGLPAAYAYTWYQEGEEPARTLLRETAKKMRDAAKAFKASFEKPKKQVKSADDQKEIPAEPVQPVGEIDPNDPASSK
jgi:hypothetical protein